MQRARIPTAYIAGKKDIGFAYRRRELYSNKHMNGRVLVVGGGAPYHGAPVLAATAANNTLAALRVGAGYAITCVPKSVELAVRKTSPNLIVRALSGAHLNAGDLKELKTAAKRSQAVVVGPGLGRSASTLNTVARFVDHLSASGKKAVIDADALYAMKKVKRLNKNLLITPNTHEFELFYPHKISETDTGTKIKAAKAAAGRLNACVMLKGHKTVVSDGKRIKVIAARTPALATMGTGDVLAGIVGGFAAMGAGIFDAAVAGAYLHALIGDKLRDRMGDHIIAADVVDAIPMVLKVFDKKIR